MAIIPLDIPRLDSADRLGRVNDPFGDERRRAMRLLAGFELSHVLWKPRPAGMRVVVRAAHVAGNLLLLYSVVERAVRAKHPHDQDPVYTDSCVEFFVSAAPGEPYYNLEWNAIGTMLAACGRSRHDRIRLSPDTLSRVERYPTLGREVFELRIGPLISWELLLVIPLDVIGLAGGAVPPSGRVVRANVCKCGDELPEPHYLSWAPIDTPTPDFHRPEFFRPMRLL